MARKGSRFTLLFEQAAYGIRKGDAGYGGSQDEDIGQIWNLVLERTGEATKLESQNLQLMEKIKTLSDWKAFKNSDIKIKELDLDCCKALMERFKAGKMGKSKDKQKRNRFKALQKRIKNLEKAVEPKGK